MVKFELRDAEVTHWKTHTTTLIFYFSIEKQEWLINSYFF